MVEIIVLSNNLGLYCLSFVISLFLLIKIKKEFSEEGIIDYIIYLTTKINLFIILLSSIFIISVLIVDSQYNINGFLKETINIILIYSYFNYGLMYFFKLIDYIIKFSKNNDLYTLKFLKDKGGFKK